MNIKESVKEYLGLKSDAFKLGLVENFSLVINQFLGTFLLILILLTALIFLATGANKWLGTVLDNAVAASFITGGFFLLLFLILFLLRKRLFVNNFVRLFAKMFFEEKDPNARED
ncbi:MAG: hypothetical protein WCQ69_07905 [Bacteroidales bacterium]|nr:hypothetical protein [Bacteroidales bacterium]MDD2264742.1 hypothetical protein [Bacteroidales bacterium]MDD2831840.1 hypothetical protein [Bacteroidales bacterium]MDD3209161.1 hypothetical protein [Bacteroidales bacterium]MDD3697963.1 hypothetical protein [Bacteroidales bacterium]